MIPLIGSKNSLCRACAVPARDRFGRLVLCTCPDHTDAPPLQALSPGFTRRRFLIRFLFLRVPNELEQTTTSVMLGSTVRWVRPERFAVFFAQRSQPPLSDLAANRRQNEDLICLFVTALAAFQMRSESDLPVSYRSPVRHPRFECRHRAAIGQSATSSGAAVPSIHAADQAGLE